MPGSKALPGAWERLKAQQQRARHRAATLAVRVLASGAIDPIKSAKAAGLRYINDQSTPGIRRLGKPNHFQYLDPRGRPIRNRAEIARIRALAIPPAWSHVWICPEALGHLQATGRDARGRKQYRYHPQWRQVRDEVKYGRLIAFARALPRIRRQTSADLNRRGLPRDRVLAVVVELLDKTLIRIGNEEYARANRSYGLTTMRDEHAKVAGAQVNFEFRGKSGIQHTVGLHDARLARIIKACRDLPGYELFQYVDDAGNRQTVGSADVNAYLRAATGEDFTAKDFRTWAGTVMAATALVGAGRPKSANDARRKIAHAVEQVANRLGNTKAVCRRCYIHPAVLESYMDGTIETARRVGATRMNGANAALSPGEAAVAALLERRLSKTA
jgi:DNA topoisomerase-1